MASRSGAKRDASCRSGPGRRASYDLRARIVKDVARILVDRPSDELNMQALVRLTGVSLWTLRYHFGTFDGLFRAASVHVIEEAETTLPSLRSPAEGVIGAIRHYAGALQEATSAAAYRNMLYLVVRHGKTHDWLREAYHRRIVGKVCSDLSERVLRVSERLGAPILFKEGVARRFHRRIETEFALRSLLSPFESPPAEEVDALLGEIARETFLGTYCFDWQTTNAA